MVAGVIGTAANIGIFLFATLTAQEGFAIDVNNWRWVYHIGAAPIVLGIVAWIIVPESPRWMAARDQATVSAESGATVGVFRPPLLSITLVGIVLATIPMIGGWGTANWMNPWAEDAVGAAFRSTVLQWRALTGLVGSLLGGWIAIMAGRRTTYFLVSLASLALAQYIFGCLKPTDGAFLFWVSVLGFVSGVYFGWLPLCLPEMFPTRVRSTGAGVGFNFGRVVTAVTIFVTGALTTFFEGDYALIGQCTSWLFVIGIVAICFARDTGAKELDD
jgi:MFS family permease